MIRMGNSVQIMRAEIIRQGDSMVIDTSIPDWAHYPPLRSKLKREGDKISFNTYYGKATMMLDTSYLEMVGKVSQGIPPYNFHLKKSLRPFQPTILSQDIEIENEGAKISGTLYYPQRIQGKLNAAVIVHGRGCSPRRYKATRAQKLAEYGIAAFVYDKRGSKPSGYPCEKSTHDLNVSDVSTIVSEVARHDRIDQVGLISYSAGGWIASHVTRVSEIPIAFLITIVGPTTSVLEQQLDGLEAFLMKEGKKASAIEDAKVYTRLMFEKDDPKKTFKKMQQLLKKGEASGWTNWLVEDDYASSPEAIKDMWVQRFSYDPAEDLEAYKGPYLAIFGENDPVVPYQKQLARLEQLMTKSGKTNYVSRVIPEASHGLEHGPEVREL